MVLKTQKRYEEILKELSEIRKQKVIAYGEDRYLETDKEFNHWMCYSDIYRKFIRLKELTKNQTEGESLLDTYRDMANYSIMAIQILEQYYED